MSELEWRIEPVFSYKCPKCGTWQLEGSPLDDCPNHREGRENPRYRPSHDSIRLPHFVYQIRGDAIRLIP